MTPHDISCAIIALAIVMSLRIFEGWTTSIEEDESFAEQKRKRFYLRTW